MSAQADTAKRLREEKRYAEALNLHEQAYAASGDLFERYWAAYCLQKLGRPGEARDACEEIIAKDSEHRFARSLLGRLIYDLETRDAKHCDARYVAAVGRIATLADGTDGGRYGPYSRFAEAALHGLKLLAQDGHWQDMLIRAQRIDVKRLSDEPPTLADGKRGWSDRARWHSQVTKALEHTEAWAELDRACTEAFLGAPSLQGTEGNWFTFRRARALRHLGKTDEALTLLSSLVNRPRADAAFLGEMAHLQVQRGEPQSAMSYFGQALLARAPAGVQVRLLADVRPLLETRGDGELAAKHRQLETAVRSGEGWPVNGPVLAPGDVKALQRELHIAWQTWADAAVEWTQGSIAKLLPSGSDGFIETPAGARFYFSLRDLEGRREVAAGDPVDFVGGERLDKKRNEIRPAALRVRVRGTE